MNGKTVTNASEIPPRVFISYSHDSPDHEQLVPEFANQLRGHGCDAEQTSRPEHDLDQGKPV